jgi:hypothetical protein
MAAYFQPGTGNFSPNGQPQTPQPGYGMQGAQPGQAANQAYPTQGIPGMAGGINDMFRSAMQGNPNLMKNMKNSLFGGGQPGQAGSPMNINPPSPTMSALFTNPPQSTSSSNGIY